MTEIRCWDDACIFWVAGMCTAEEVEYSPDHGCLTMREREEFEDTLDWEEEEEELDEEEWEGEV